MWPIPPVRCNAAVRPELREERTRRRYRQSDAIDPERTLLGLRIAGRFFWLDRSVLGPSPAASRPLARIQFLQFVTGAAAFTMASEIANAQTYPSRPIPVIVPTGAGGPQDVVARIVTERMRGSLGQAIIIENVAGANGTLGIGRVARADRMRGALDDDKGVIC